MMEKFKNWNQEIKTKDIFDKYANESDFWSLIISLQLQTNTPLKNFIVKNITKDLLVRIKSKIKKDI